MFYAGQQWKWKDTVLTVTFVDGDRVTTQSDEYGFTSDTKANMLKHYECLSGFGEVAPLAYGVGTEP